MLKNKQTNKKNTIKKNMPGKMIKIIKAFWGKYRNDKTYYRRVVRKGFFKESTSEEPMENEEAGHKVHVLREYFPTR